MWRLGPRGGWNKQSQSPTFQSFIVQCGGHEPCATIEVKKLKKSFSQSDIWYLWCPISREGGHGNPLQYSSLENPMDRGAWRATVHGVSERLHFKWWGLGLGSFLQVVLSIGFSIHHGLYNLCWRQKKKKKKKFKYRWHKIVRNMEYPNCIKILNVFDRWEQ